MKIADRIFVVLASVFFVGYLPLIPGTFGSFAGLGIFFLLRRNMPAALFATLLIMVLGFVVSGRAEKALGRKDHRCIVIDEVAGMLLSLLALPCYGIETFIAAFFLFRLLDTLKPYPAGSFESNPGALGIMGDDIIAGAYVNIILQVVLRLASCRAS